MWVHIDTILCFVEAVQCGAWQVEARQRLQLAFVPKLGRPLILLR